MCLACVQTSPISFVARGKGGTFSACNKGNRRRLHTGKFVPFVVVWAQKWHPDIHILMKTWQGCLLIAILLFLITQILGYSHAVVWIFN